MLHLCNNCTYNYVQLALKSFFLTILERQQPELKKKYKKIISLI